MKVIATLGIAIMLSGLTLAACGGADTQTQAQAEAAAPQPKPDPPPTPPEPKPPTPTPPDTGDPPPEKAPSK
ncbi:MAG: hypothetical protein IPM79_29230 [Polyangiaceae bacterium]|jgi:hypothetical protein|nr:hypothetical protein [Polyangiaceae bacterium]MBK8941576.1 hypothetical protein [Polyangiaceae bacterium]